MASKLVRTIRKRIIEAMAAIDDWRVDPDKVTRVSDGLWVRYVAPSSRSPHIEVGNGDHGVAQIIIECDSEIVEAYSKLQNFHPMIKRHRSILNDLGIEAP